MLGILDSSVRKRLLQEESLTFDKAYELAKQFGTIKSENIFLDHRVHSSTSYTTDMHTTSDNLATRKQYLNKHNQSYENKINGKSCGYSHIKIDVQLTVECANFVIN